MNLIENIKNVVIQAFKSEFSDAFSDKSDSEKSEQKTLAINEKDIDITFNNFSSVS